jgi:hypothetical protein
MVWDEGISWRRPTALELQAWARRGAHTADPLPSLMVRVVAQGRTVAEGLLVGYAPRRAQLALVGPNHSPGGKVWVSQARADQIWVRVEV